MPMFMLRLCVELIIYLMWLINCSYMYTHIRLIIIVIIGISIDIIFTHMGNVWLEYCH